MVRSTPWCRFTGTNLISLDRNDTLHLWRPLFYLPSGVPGGRVLCSFDTCFSEKPLGSPYAGNTGASVGMSFVTSAPAPLLWVLLLVAGRIISHRFSPLRPARFSLGLLISLLKHVRPASVKLSKAYLWLFSPSNSFFHSLDKRENVTTVLSSVGVWNKQKRLAVTESTQRKEIHLWF